MKKLWSNKLPAVQFRIARPTDQLEKILEFYRDGIGLEVVGSFEKHNGYDGVMLGLPDVRYHLEFTQYENGSPCPAPTEDSLLVFYIPDKERRGAIVKRLMDMGYPPVQPENPYWEKDGITIADTDGWRIVLQNTNGL
jgi:catechol 2,3-dioxygenase-like lactoylglutathione lyase family enzyme